jgi:hypothetical protein
LLWATDGDYAVITDFTSIDTLQLSGSYSDYVIGAAPGSNATPGAFAQNNISGFNKDLSPVDLESSTNFGIYYINGVSTPNLVATVNTAGFNLGALSRFHNINGVEVNGTYEGLGGITSVNDDNVNRNYLGMGAMYDLLDSSFANRVTFA